MVGVDAGVARVWHGDRTVVVQGGRGAPAAARFARRSANKTAEGPKQALSLTRERSESASTIESPGSTRLHVFFTPLSAKV